MSGKEVRINMKRTEIVAKTEELVTPIIEENHFELVDVEYVREGANMELSTHIKIRKSLGRGSSQSPFWTVLPIML